MLAVRMNLSMCHGVFMEMEETAWPGQNEPASACLQLDKDNLRISNLERYEILQSFGWREGVASGGCWNPNVEQMVNGKTDIFYENTILEKVDVPCEGNRFVLL